jgi:hypothetical protein
MSRALELGLAIVSVVMALAMVAAVPWYVRRLSPDHFVRPPAKRSLALTILRNVAGAALVALGIVLLFLPGQGVLTILIGLTLLDLPFKHRVLMRLLQVPKIQEGMQRMRASAGQPPLILPASPAHAHG